MKLSDYVASFVYKLGVRHVFSLPGGGNMHLVDSFRDSYVAMLHEQACAFAADGYARINGIGVCLPTTGPGGTNAITGVLGAWQDSIPILFISGQVGRDMMRPYLRQFGVQEADVVTMVKSITKYAQVVHDPQRIRYMLEFAVHRATCGRKGPVWLDIPLDVQAAEVNPDTLESFDDLERPVSDAIYAIDIAPAIELLSKAHRPVLIIGAGARESRIFDLCEHLDIPVVSSWAAAELYNGENYIGRLGIMGDIASTTAIKYADLLLVVGCRLGVAHLGWQYTKFAEDAKIIMVDLDPAEIMKTNRVALPLITTARYFVEKFLAAPKMEVRGWLDVCLANRKAFPVVNPEYPNNNSWKFIDQLSDCLQSDDVIVTDMGASYTSTFQAFKIKMGQRLFTSQAVAQMGYGLPAAIGACLSLGRRVICMHGDGGLQVNVQALETMARLKLPITLFVFSNGGYLTIKHTQRTYFKHMVGCSAESGLNFPSLAKIADSYGVPYWKYDGDIVIKPGLCEVVMDPDQWLKLTPPT